MLKRVSRRSIELRALLIAPRPPCQTRFESEHRSSIEDPFAVTTQRRAAVENERTPRPAARIGDGEEFVCEIDEGDGSIALFALRINNISLDHKPIQELRTLFRDFANKGAGLQSDRRPTAETTSLSLAATKNLGDRVEIRIRDSGIGFPSEVKEKMFNPFFTTRPAEKGTRLSLSISHDIIVKQHLGSIEVDTQPGEFTEVRIMRLLQLPLSVSCSSTFFFSQFQRHPLQRNASLSESFHNMQRRAAYPTRARFQGTMS